VVLGEEMIRRVTSIDGAVLLDAEGRCHAVGAILDGRATADGRPARGARYNSALRYVRDAGCPTLAVVVSEDGRVDVLPDEA
jgi:DNA integrity scanning protein DisA with diadenylate cyclase activity